MSRFWFIFFICFSCALPAQENYRIKPLFDVNTERNEGVAAFVSGQLVVASYGVESAKYLSLRKATNKTTYRRWKREADYSDWSNPKSFLPAKWHLEGPVSYSEIDQAVFFSSRKNFDGAKGNQAKLYVSHLNGDKWGSPKLLPVNNFSSESIHPSYDSERGVLVFSSNRGGSLGGMDLWYCARTENGWTYPLNLGLGVNSVANEVFPSFHNGDIYFATNAPDTWGGYDIRHALGRTQWKNVIADGAPFNSAADDMFLLFIDNDRAILTSNRAGGMGGDDLFLLTQEPSSQEKHRMSAKLECEGCNSRGMKVTVTNTSDGIVQTLYTDYEGSLNMSTLLLGQSYLLQLDTMQKFDFSKCRLVVTDAEGNRYLDVSFAEKGNALLELLPFLLCDFQGLNSKDQSFLKLELEGQIYRDNPGDIGFGEPITILNSKGEPVALAYTNDSGKFRFTKLDPQLNYVMRLSEQSEAEHALITARGKKIEIPVLNAEINYRRIKTEDALVLVNEDNDTIYVSSDDLFVINRIYYDFDNAGLNNESTKQLEQLLSILERNPNVCLELRAHTDARGDAAYNLKLSERRAITAIQFLEERGILARRLHYKFFGESELLNECEDGVQCTEPEHALNRRTEIRFERQIKYQALGQ